jgi:hypothetical protein
MMYRAMIGTIQSNSTFKSKFIFRDQEIDRKIIQLGRLLTVTLHFEAAELASRILPWSFLF